MIAGDLAMVGAPEADGKGAVYVFERQGVHWVETAKLVAGDGSSGDHFGDSIALQGDTAMIGASWDAGHSGSVYVFERIGSTWTEAAKLVASDGGGEFGCSLAIDGDTVVIGARMNSSAAAGAGAVFVFTRTGGVWTEQAKIFPSDLEDWDMFGEVVDIRAGVPSTILISNPADYDVCDSAGSVYVFVGQGAGWGQQAKLYPPSGTWDGHFGRALVLGDGFAVIGEPGYSGGRTHVFTKAGYNWNLSSTLQGSDITSYDDFGSELAMSGDRLFVGSSYQYGGTGAVYAFAKAGTGWVEERKIVGSDPALGRRFTVCSFDGVTALMGAPLNDSAAPDAGAAYVYSLAPGVGYCFGDPGVDAPCPCNNDNDGSVPGSGCDNGVFASGAHLTGLGIASVSEDSLVLVTTGLEPNNSGLYFQADNDRSPGVPWGDGLSCAGGALKRLGVRTSDAGGASNTSAWTTPISVKAGNVLAGQTKYYQCWYRSQQNSPCGAEFNASNGFAVLWLP